MIVRSKDSLFLRCENCHELKRDKDIRCILGVFVCYDCYPRVKCLYGGGLGY